MRHKQSQQTLCGSGYRCRCRRRSAIEPRRQRAPQSFQPFARAGNLEEGIALQRSGHDVAAERDVGVVGLFEQPFQPDRGRSASCIARSRRTSARSKLAGNTCWFSPITSTACRQNDSDLSPILSAPSTAASHVRALLCVQLRNIEAGHHSLMSRDVVSYPQSNGKL